MAKRLIDLGNPDENTRKRIEEIKFYLFIKSLSNDGQIDARVTTLLETFAKLTDTSKTIIVVAALALADPHNRPIKNEIAIAASFLKFPVRKIYNLIGIHEKSYYQYINLHIKNNAILMPRLEKEADAEIIKFNYAVKELLKLSEVLFYEC